MINSLPWDMNRSHVPSITTSLTPSIIQISLLAQHNNNISHKSSKQNNTIGVRRESSSNTKQMGSWNKRIIKWSLVLVMGIATTVMHWEWLENIKNKFYGKKLLRGQLKNYPEEPHQSYVELSALVWQRRWSKNVAVMNSHVTFFNILNWLWFT